MLLHPLANICSGPFTRPPPTSADFPQCPPRRAPSADPHGRTPLPALIERPHLPPFVPASQANLHQWTDPPRPAAGPGSSSCTVQQSLPAPPSTWRRPAPESARDRARGALAGYGTRGAPQRHDPWKPWKTDPFPHFFGTSYNIDYVNLMEDPWAVEWKTSAARVPSPRLEPSSGSGTPEELRSRLAREHGDSAPQERQVRHERPLQRPQDGDVRLGVVLLFDHEPPVQEEASDPLH